MSEKVTVFVIGLTGVGKSANGNAFLQKNDAFETSSNPDSCTMNLQVEQNLVDGVMRYYIDTAGLDSTDEEDQQHMIDLVNSLNDLNIGINAFFLVISLQSPRMTSKIRDMITTLNNFFDDIECWKQAGIIFTKCNYDDDDIDSQIQSAKAYRENVIKFIKTFPKCGSIEIDLPCFFVNCKKWETDEVTQLEYRKIFDFANQFAPNVHKFQVAALNVQDSYDPSKVQKLIDRIIEPGQKSVETFAFGKNRTFTLDENGKIVIPITITYYFLEEYRLNWNSVEIVENSSRPIEAKYDFERMIVYPVLQNQYLETYIFHRIRWYWYTFWDTRRKSTRCTRKLKFKLGGDFVFKENNSSEKVIESPNIDPILSINQNSSAYEKKERTPVPQFFEITMN